MHKGIKWGGDIRSTPHLQYYWKYIVNFDIGDFQKGTIKIIHNFDYRRATDMLKKHLICSIYCISILLMLCSCSYTEDEILEKVERYTSVTVENTVYDYQNDLADWLTQETAYIYEEEHDTTSGIINLFDSNYNIMQERMYFQIRKPLENSTGADFWAYISLKTGEKHYLCPDPLCEHTRNSGCQYVDLQTLIFHPEDGNVVYTTKYIFSEGVPNYAICEIDLENNKIVNKYCPDGTTENLLGINLELFFINENILYFSERHIIRERAENGEYKDREETYLKAYDLINNTVEILSDKFNTNSDFLYVLNDRIFFLNQYEQRLYTSDMDFATEQDVITFGENCEVYNAFYDSNTENIYILIRSIDMTIPKSAGKLYCINGKSLQCEEISLPVEQILQFQLTNEYFYYTLYDPVEYGMTPWGYPAIREDNTKIYRVQRDDPNSAELVFDGKNELFYKDYIVTGDYLYINYIRFIQSEGKSWWRQVGTTARINFINQTIKWLNLD